MKAIRINASISSIRSKVDKSLGLSIQTPELTIQERAEFMELQGVNVDLFIKPLDDRADDILEIDKDLNQKSQSQRMRSILYLLWEQEGKQGRFDEYYHEKTEKYIEYLKEKLN